MKLLENIKTAPIYQDNYYYAKFNFIMYSSPTLAVYLVCYISENSRKELRNNDLPFVLLIYLSINFNIFMRIILPN